MRPAALFVLSLLGAVAFTPRPGSAQVSVTIRLGNPVAITHYSPDVYGDWHTAYRTWQPVTLYFYDGHYYSRWVRGARPVQVYRRQNQYFLPPQDPAWANHGDRRYNYKRRPIDDDYGRAAPPPPRSVEPRPKPRTPADSRSRGSRGASKGKQGPHGKHDGDHQR